jgi:Putative F0F1-ATPase subunit Ca2+/Mg2+ transporter
MSFRNLGRYGTVGFDILLSGGVGLFIGTKLEARYGSGRGYYTLFGVGVGFVTGFYSLYKASLALRRDADREVRESKGEIPYADEYLELVRGGENANPEKDESQAPGQMDTKAPSLDSPQKHRERGPS